ncbi:MotA/TolQ/ExbB proton channel family protein [Roseibacillus ishigakijimensis]|uniref:MotA/TolQ/ExbB proton channel family protein n=1 Tax=Roseibacillus ishigakijimensis TaxID=454146 RepID=A0A934RT11_9BACT|nr:MotA/TolQ/ExbB proton channel family protein [Roseibacillus ishigakijimensis]MBK1835392.1 MotA/TolQ/ExbB proton channel family protein [Roseibacillus ishigakijimensis]
MSDLLEAGGPILWVQLVLAFLGLVLILERLLFFQTVKTRVPDLLRGLQVHIGKQAFSEALFEASRERGPAARVAHSVLVRHHLPRTNLCEVAEEAVKIEVPRIERNLRSLLAVAMMAPLTGLLGTALGLLDVFGSVVEVGSTVAQATLARGIFESLVTTVVGLAIATGTYGFYLVLLGKARALLGDLERTGIEMVNLVVDAREQADVVLLREERAESKARQRSGRSQ